MSQSAAVPSSELRESLQVSSLTLLVLVLIPCVVLLLLLNCLLLGYKLLLFARRKSARYSSESVLLRSSSSSLSARQRIARFTDDPSFGPVRKTKPASVSEPMLAAPPITSSLTSSAERVAACGQRCRSEALARPDEATYAGSGSLWVPSTLLRGSRAWRRSAPVLLQSSDSEMERENVAPPNSPEQLVTQSRVRVLIGNVLVPQLNPDFTI